MLVRVKRIILIIITIFIILISETYATDGSIYQCNLSITGNKTQLKAGESITYDINVTDIQAGSGIITFKALIEYNSNIFNCNVISADESKWTKVGFVENLLMMTRADLEPNAENQTIAKVIFTAKSNATIGDVPLKFSQIVFGMENDKSFQIPDVRLTIPIVADAPTGDGDSTDNNEIGNNEIGNNEIGNNEIGNNEIGNNEIDNNNQISDDNNHETNDGNNNNIVIQENNEGNIKPNQTNKEVNDDTTKERIPQTGIEDGWLLSAIAIMSIVAIVSYKKVQKMS